MGVLRGRSALAGLLALAAGLAGCAVPGADPSEVFQIVDDGISSDRAAQVCAANSETITSDTIRKAVDGQLSDVAEIESTLGVDFDTTVDGNSPDTYVAFCLVDGVEADALDSAEVLLYRTENGAGISLAGRN